MSSPTLSKNLPASLRRAEIGWPPAECFAYPEKILQFGTGVLLRGLTDYFIDKANKQGIFCGRILVVKSTDSGDTKSFAAQDNLYTLCVRGIEEGRRVEENIVNAAISRVLSAREDWPAILAAAANPELTIIVSNTTEVGIQLEEDDITQSPPKSFPGKLLAFLRERYTRFGGDRSRGFVIIPTELIPDNGQQLKTVLLDLAGQNKLDPDFIGWITEANDFCSSLVDRIVPGKLPEAEMEKTSAMLGYRDELMIMAEVYRLWAIETSRPETREILSFSGADEGLVIAPDIRIFRELKLRILNGSHTLSCGLGFLAGFRIVREAMEDPAFLRYIEFLIGEEIIPAITDRELTREMARNFAAKVLDRYRNPYLEHQWLSITMQYSSKMKMRDLPLLLRHYEISGSPPAAMALGWAAHIFFMRGSPGEDQRFYGEINGKNYLVNDNQAARYAQAWKSPKDVADKILADEELWGRDLHALPGFADAVRNQLYNLQQAGAKKTLADFLKK